MGSWYHVLLVMFFSISLHARDEVEVVDRHESAVATTEQQDVSNQNAELSKQLQALQQQVKDMAEMTQAMQNDLNNLSQELKQISFKQQQIYTDVDQRIQRIETGTVNEADSLDDDLITLAPIEGDETPNQTIPSEFKLQTEVITPQKPTVDTADSKADQNQQTNNTDTVASDQAKTNDPNEIRTAYQRSFNLLQEGLYKRAIKSFGEFLQQYPSNIYSGNAQYWLGEANYVTEEYEMAINEYQELIKAYPDNKKLPQAILKIGYSYHELNNIAEAIKIFERVNQEYPSSTEAKLAQEKLIELKGQTSDATTL